MLLVEHISGKQVGKATTRQEDTTQDLSCSALGQYARQHAGQPSFCQGVAGRKARHTLMSRRK